MAIPRQERTAVVEAAVLELVSAREMSVAVKWVEVLKTILLLVLAGH
jgi:hypothetical protein